MTKCVVSHVRYGHNVSQPTTISQIAHATPQTTLCPVWPHELAWVATSGHERRGDNKHQHRADEPFPVRMPCTTTC